MKILPKKIFIRDYTYELPSHQIAEFPLEQRDLSKLLVYKKGQITDEVFLHIPALLPAGTTLVLNDTRVIEARLLFQKQTGGVIEIFCLEPYRQSIEEAMQQKETAVWKCLIGGASKWKAGQILEKKLHSNGSTLFAKYIARNEDDFLIEFSWQPSHLPFVEVLHAAGAIPLPPYIKRSPEKIDAERYQTVFSRHEGSVAAPTAALHFTKEILKQLSEKNIDAEYITLHVGAGTFKPVKTETIAEHQMHGEPFSVKKSFIEKLILSERVVAVGTTSLRTLESIYWLGLKLKNEPDAEPVLSQWEVYEIAEKNKIISVRESLHYLLTWMNSRNIDIMHCHTSLLIVPGYSFKIPAGLITNFHQPQSTLLLLVAAFIGEDWKRVYQHALSSGYRFLSYGDSSLLWRS